MIDFTLPEELVELRDRVTRFVRTVVVPNENDPRQSMHGPQEALRLELVALGRQAGLLSPHAPEEYGGMGLDHRGIAVVFEAAGWSPLGPLALNVQAPDEGNVHLLDVVASPEQKARWLAPLARGEGRSFFSMTETTDNGAGADPSLLRTTAQETADGWVINGRKYMITGVPGAAFSIVMARTIDRAGNDLGASMFFVDVDAPGFTIDRVLDTVDSNAPGGHAEVS
jgi:acyl-CoA dehydrogenase